MKMTGFTTLALATVVALVAKIVHHIFISPQGVVLSPPPVTRLDTCGKPRAEIWGYVTGGTSGIGRSFALELLNRGYSVIITGTSEKSVEAGLAALKEEWNSTSSSAQRIEGVVMDITKIDEAKQILENAIANHDLRIVLYSAFPEKFKPVYTVNSSFIRPMVDSMATALVEGVAVSTRHWIQTNKTGVFIGCSSVSSHAEIVAGELYTSLRTFQSRFLYQNAQLFLSNHPGGYADEQTRQILISVAEIPVVDTPLMRKLGPERLAKMAFLLWNSNDYARQVLHRALDRGHSFIVEGWGWRIRRALSGVYPFHFGQHSPERVEELRLIMQ